MIDPDIIQAAFQGSLGSFAIDVAFAVPARGVTALFGPSGCGKTTVLRAMAGLQRFARGTCVVDGDVWQRDATFLPPHRRPVGYVFQEASLFPHLSVRKNLLFGAPRTALAADLPFDEVADLLGLQPLLHRGPAHLSGGERQRVALGRALLSRPRLLLMDEPLAALDQTARDEILPFLERLRARLAVPILYVTHERHEVERLADTLVLMRHGRVEAAGALHALQSDPANPFALGRDAAVMLEAQVAGYDAEDGLATLTVAGHALLVPTRRLSLGERLRVRIAAADVSLAATRPAATTILNILPVTVMSATATVDHGMQAVLALGDDGPHLLARITQRSWRRLGLRPGTAMFAQVKSVALTPPG